MLVQGVDSSLPLTSALPEQPVATGVKLLTARLGTTWTVVAAASGDSCGSSLGRTAGQGLEAATTEAANGSTVVGTVLVATYAFPFAKERICFLC